MKAWPSLPPTKPALSLEILRGRSVLVLDDEESLRLLLEEGLSSQGLRVDCAATVEEALPLIQRSSYDILLCDLHLTAGGYFVDGREAAGRLLSAARSPKPGVVYMTGDLMDSAQAVPAHGEPGYLQKPFRISDVIALIVEALSPAVTHN